jgi:beta-glucuronidase
MKEISIPIFKRKFINCHFSYRAILAVSFLFHSYSSLQSQPYVSNVPGREFTSLNGKWEIIIDPFNAGAGNWKPVWKDQSPSGKSDFYEYKFDEAITLNVP